MTSGCSTWLIWMSQEACRPGLPHGTPWYPQDERWSHGILRGSLFSDKPKSSDALPSFKKCPTFRSNLVMHCPVSRTDINRHQQTGKLPDIADLVVVWLQQSCPGRGHFGLRDDWRNHFPSLNLAHPRTKWRFQWKKHRNKWRFQWQAMFDDTREYPQRTGAYRQLHPRHRGYESASKITRGIHGLWMIHWFIRYKPLNPLYPLMADIIHKI